MKRLLCALLLSATYAPLNIDSVDRSVEPRFDNARGVVKPVEVTGARG